MARSVWEAPDPEGGLFLRDAPEMLAAGQWVARVPNKPGMA